MSDFTKDINVPTNDCISRQAAIDAILLNQEVYSNNFGNDPIDKYTIAIIDNDAQTIAQLPSAQPEPRWIPVTEKLPEANEIDEKGFIKAYLVQDARWMDVARWNGDVWIAWGYGTVLKDVTAWMPLPEPWKGGEA